MLRKTALLSALAAFTLTGALRAEENDVLMMGHGYFPNTLHAEIGDTIRFVNATRIPMAATAQDGSWTSGVLFENDAFVLTVTEGMTGAYTNALPDLGGVMDAGTAAEIVRQTSPASGIIDYLLPAPVELDAAGKPLHLTDNASDNG